MINTMILHTKNGTQVITHDELYENAKEQENTGIKPAYVMYDPKTGEHITRPGWLVFSTWQDGAGIVTKYPDNTYRLITGWQGEFTII